MSNFEKVKDFSNAFGVKKYTIFNTDVLNDTHNNKLRFSLIEEEINELEQATKTYDLIETRDALADILYVLYGCADSFGIDIDDKMSERIKNSEFKIAVYDELFNKKNNCFNIDVLKNKNYIHTFMVKIFEIRDILDNSIKEKKCESIINSLCHLLHIIYKTSECFGIDVNSDFEIVHNSNMSKICKTEDEAIKTVKKYETDNRYPQPYYEENNYGYIVKNKTTGKVLKSINYIPVKFNN